MDNSVWDRLKESLGSKDLRKGDRFVSSIYESLFESRKWVEELPFLKFPSHWQVQIIPAFMCAVVRFRVKTENSRDWISVYFDGYSNLGYCNNEPYWEIHPSEDGDPKRFLLGEEDEMLREIENALKNEESEKE